MSLCRIRKLEIVGFRAFGRNVQTLEFPSLLAAVWGSNSQGKTSLAEAVEFLLTGQIVRRELMASSQDEFADALRNAHLPPSVRPFVQATITCPDGSPRTIRRILTTDFGKKQNCETILEIDGKTSTEADLPPLGIVLSQPPLRAPVLAQHTLGYLFSARPQDRATYFKALLEVTELEEFRNAVAALEQDIVGPSDSHIEKLTRAVAISHAARHLIPLLATAPNLADINAAFAVSSKDLIEAHGETVPEEHKDRIKKLETILAEKRAKTFALKGFDRKPVAEWHGPEEEVHGKLSILVAERAKVEEETRRMASLFREALALPAVAEASEPIDCPLCDAHGSLTPERIAFIRQRAEDTESFKNALEEARESLFTMATSLQTAASAIKDSLPLFISNPSKFRRSRGFRVDRILSMLGADSKPNIDAWLAALRTLVRKRTAAVLAIRALAVLIEQYVENSDTLTDFKAVKSAFEKITTAYSAYVAALANYDPIEKMLSTALKVVVDAESQTGGWQELIELARDQETLRTSLIDRFVREQIRSELMQAVRHIDKGNEKVLEEKFQELSDGVQHWWNLLRPDDLSFFTGVKPRPGTRRTIDFKAGLATQPDRSDVKLRDVIAVFSQSQLHCLGLALFLARSVKEGAGFIVLDDPILSSDEDYRAFFNAMVIEDLLKKGIQVIILTQDQRTWKNLGERYRHENIRQFQIVLDNPADGSAVADTADDLETQFIKADTLVRGGHPAMHKQGGEAIRDAAERFCKQILVTHRREKGDPAASLTDYDGKNLGDLSPMVEPLLVKDPSHSGKLRTIGAETNPAKHDDAIPAAGTLKVALGDLRYLKRQYL